MNTRDQRPAGQFSSSRGFQSPGKRPGARQAAGGSGPQERGRGWGAGVRLLVEVGLGLLALDGGVQAVYVLLRVETLCVLNCVMGLRVDKTVNSQS